MPRSLMMVLLCWSLTSIAYSADPPPRSLDPRLKVTLFAENPQLVTPTGIDVDPQGRVWVIESNTHFPPEGYKGHPSDRILVMSDTDGDGKAETISVFADGLTHAMSIAVGRMDGASVKSSKSGNGEPGGKGQDQDPQSSASKPSRSSNSSHFSYSSYSSHPSHSLTAHVATRREILLLVDDDGDGKADRRERLVHLETAGNYPHNGLAGFAFDGMGWMYFGFGENLGADYKIIGRDGVTLSGGGEGGNLYRCRLDGTELSQIATGFWNPHANCVDAFGRIFSVDNDPDSRPPCRLLHVVPDADFGYRFRNGRKGLHPFTAWNGEVPGTLPMVAGTGEAPSGIVAYESDGLPEEYRGNLLGTSWGDHRIERFRLAPRGASFQSLAEPLIVGGENFRPVGLAVAPDGSLYFSDWVLRDYKVHGKGRVWRVSWTDRPKRTEPDDILKRAGMKVPLEEWISYLDSPRIELRRFSARHLAPTITGRRALLGVLKNSKSSPRAKVESLWALFSSPLPPEADHKELAAVNLFKAKDVVSTAAAWQIGTAALPLDDTAIRKILNETLGLLLSEETDLPIDRGFVLPLLAKVKWEDGDRLVPAALSIRDPYVVGTMVPTMARTLSGDEFAKYLNPGAGTASEIARAMTLAARRKDPNDLGLLTMALNHPEADVKRVAVQWVAETKRQELRPQLEKILNRGAVTSDLLLSTLAGLEMLDGKSPADFDKTPASKYVLAILNDPDRPSGLVAQTLRLVSPTSPELKPELFQRLLSSDDQNLRLEAVRTLQGSSLPEAAPLLLALAQNPKESLALRAEAFVGLSAALGQKQESTRSAILEMLKSDVAILRFEALRAARGPAAQEERISNALVTIAEQLPPMGTRPTDDDRELAEQIALALAGAEKPLPERVAKLRPKRPGTKQEWMATLAKGRAVDVEAGRRIFYHPNAAGCFKCHTIDGRGGKVGPDLTNAIRTMNRPQFIESILEPSREVAPQFVSWTFTMNDGKVHTGLIVEENEGRLTIGDTNGKTIELKSADVEERVPQKVSVMPEKLADRMTLQEFRDLLAFLDSLQKQ